MVASARVRNLATIIRLLVKLLSLVLDMLSSASFLKLTVQQKAAIEALRAAVEAVLAVLPAPGSDNDPSTLT